MEMLEAVEEEREGRILVKCGGRFLVGMEMC